MKKILLLMMILPFLAGCKRGGHVTTGTDFNDEKSKYYSGLFDSLMWAQHHCPENEDEMIYKWNWAYTVCDSLEIYDLETLDSLTYDLEAEYKPLFGGPTPNMITAADLFAGTARFRMINAYHVLAYMTDNTPLGGDNNDYLEDFIRWEKLYQEFDDYYNEKGNIRPMNLGCYYRRLAKIRTDLLLEEIDFISGELPQQPDTSSVKKDPRWDKQHQAIRQWYDFRIQMANKLQHRDASQTQCLRTLTHKAVLQYLEFTISFEKDNQMEDI